VIQQKWSPLLLAAEVFKQLKYQLLTPWQLAQEKAQKEKAEAAAGDPPSTCTRTSSSLVLQSR
jgi:hypothetical protein